MKLSTPLLVFFLSSFASASLFGAADQVPLEDDLKVPGSNPLYFCSKPDDDLLVIDKVDLEPNPPEAGKPLSISATGNLTQEIAEGAKVHLQVKYGLITLINQEADLCDYVKEVDLSCPLKEGETQLTKDVELPNQIPPGKYTVLADVFTADDKKITCLTAQVLFHR